MPKYKVYGTWDATWTVEADSADEAEDMVDAGEAGDAEIDGYGVSNVVTDGLSYDADDEREKCVDCDHLVRNHYGLWSGEIGVRPKPHPRACNSYGCGCLSPIRQPAGAASRS